MRFTPHLLHLHCRPSALQEMYSLQEFKRMREQHRLAVAEQLCQVVAYVRGQLVAVGQGLQKELADARLAVVKPSRKQVGQESCKQAGGRLESGLLCAVP